MAHFYYTPMVYGQAPAPSMLSADFKQYGRLYISDIDGAM